MKRIEQAPMANYLWLLLILFPIFCYWQVSFMQWSMKYDMVDAFLPWRYHISESIRNWNFPLWNPYQHLGYPIHADPSSGAWYPVVWLFSYLFGYNLYAIQAEYILHIIIGGAGMFFLVRFYKKSYWIAIIIAIAYQGCGFFIGNAQHLTYIISGAWLPWVLYFYIFTISRWKFYSASAAGIFMYFMLTGGYPAFTVVLHYGLLFLFLSLVIQSIYNKNFKFLRKLIGYNILIYLVFILLSSGFLYSFYKIFPYITRSELNLNQILFGAFTPVSTISFLFPFATLKETSFFNSDISMLNAYIGLIPLIFFIYSFTSIKDYRWWILFILWLLFLLISFGEALPLREWLYHFVPFMDSFRFPAIFRYFFMVPMFLMAAYGMHYFMRNLPERNIKYLKWIVGILILVILTGVIIAAFKIHAPWLPQFWNMDLFHQKYEHSTIWQHILFQGLVQLSLLFLFMIVLSFIKDNSSLFKALLIFTVIDIFLAVQLHIGGTAVSNVKAAEVQQKINGLPDGFPIPNEAPISAITNHDHYFAPIWHNLSIFYKRTARDGFNSFMLSNYNKLDESGKAEKILNHPLVYLKNDITNQAEIIHFSPNEIKINTSVKLPDTLFLLQNYLPWWKAITNKGNIEIIKKNISIMAIPVSPEVEYVNFHYNPPRVKMFYILSAIFLVIFSVFVVYLRKMNY